jgi:tape measure domain-containing protein
MSPALRSMSNALNIVINSFESMQKASSSPIDTSSIQTAREELAKATVGFDKIEEEIKENTTEQKKHNQSINDGANAASKFKSILATVGMGIGVKEILSLSDELTQTTARLNMIVDKESNINELQEKIFASAQRSRASYMDTADTVAKLSQRTGDLFNNDEAIIFTENLNKMFGIAGASQEEIKSASLQLVQAMGSGVLRGEEFNAIFEAAPNIMQNIADYIQKNEELARGMSDAIGVSYESMSTDAMMHMRTLASEGLISADLIKNAMLGSTMDIDTQFQQLPYTWAQVWTNIKNILFQAFQPVVQFIGNAANWIATNWSKIEPIFWGIVAAVGALAVGYAIWQAVIIAVNTVQAILNGTLMANPIGLVIGLIAMIIGAIVAWINHIGGLKVAWLIVVNALMTAWDWVKIGFFTGIYFVLDLWDKLVLGLKTAGTAIANFMGDMKVSVLTILQNMVNGAIDVINGFIGTLNMIPGVSIDTISHVTFAATAAAENEAAKQAREKDLANYKKEIEKSAADRDDKLDDMKADARNEAAKRQAEIDATRAEIEANKNKKAEDDPNSLENLYEGIEDNIKIPELENTAQNTSKTAENTATMADSMESLEDSLEYLLDIAERETVNRFTTAEIRIDQTNNNNINSDMDIDGIMEKWNADFEEVLVTAAEGVHG